MHPTMQSLKATEKAPRATKPSPEPKSSDRERSARVDDEREPTLDDDLYGNLAHTD